jgi:hypothetical protein
MQAGRHAEVRWLFVLLLLASCAHDEPLPVPPIPPPHHARAPIPLGVTKAANGANAARREASRYAASEDATAAGIHDDTVQIIKMQTTLRRMKRHPTRANVAAVRRETRELRDRHRAP